MSNCFDYGIFTLCFYDVYLFNVLYVVVSIMGFYMTVLPENQHSEIEINGEFNKY